MSDKPRASKVKQPSTSVTVRSSAAEYLTFAAASSNSESSVEMRYEDDVVTYKHSISNKTTTMQTAIHTVSSRNFTRDVSAAKRAAANGPVFVTDRGRPAFALLSIERYYQMDSRAQPRSLLDVMDSIACKEVFDFSPPRLSADIQAAKFD